eukprot:1938920-Amphidinium_carterae.1
MDRRVTSKIVLPTPWTRVRSCHVRVEKACNHGSPERLVLAYSEFRMAYATVMTRIGSLALDLCGVWCVVSGEHAHALVNGLCDCCACVMYGAQVFSWRSHIVHSDVTILSDCFAVHSVRASIQLIKEHWCPSM